MPSKHLSQRSAGGRRKRLKAVMPNLCFHHGDSKVGQTKPTCRKVKICCKAEFVMRQTVDDCAHMWTTKCVIKRQRRNEQRQRINISIHLVICKLGAYFRFHAWTMCKKIQYNQPFPSHMQERPTHHRMPHGCRI